MTNITVRDKLVFVGEDVAVEFDTAKEAKEFALSLVLQISGVTK